MAPIFKKTSTTTCGFDKVHEEYYIESGSWIRSTVLNKPTESM